MKRLSSTGNLHYILKNRCKKSSLKLQQLNLKLLWVTASREREDTLPWYYWQWAIPREQRDTLQQRNIHSVNRRHTEGREIDWDKGDTLMERRHTEGRGTYWDKRTYWGNVDILKEGRHTKTREIYWRKGDILRQGRYTEGRGTYWDMGDILRGHTEGRETYWGKGDGLRQGRYTEMKETYWGKGDTQRQGRHTEGRGID